jgi:hypothetical protein
VASSTDAAFVAVIDRDCSWWNDAAPDPPEYTLQHEQVHFAIAEVVARRLTREHRELRGFGATAVEAAASFGRQSDALVRRSGDEMAARSLAFDQETSAVFQPSAQAAWYHRLMAEIGQ